MLIPEVWLTYKPTIWKDDDYYCDVALGLDDNPLTPQDLEFYSQLYPSAD